MGGGLLAYANLVRFLSGDFPVLGVLGTEEVPLEIIWFERVDAVVRAEPDPVVLAGWSLGGSIAYELAQQPGVRGRPVASGSL